MTLEMDIEFAESPPQFALRGRQPEWLETIDSDLGLFSRLLVVAPGGVGKTTLFAALAARMNGRGIKTLVLENRDRLTRQTAARIRKETGLWVEIEMAGERANPMADVVVACVQTLGRPNRLMCFADDNFGLVVPDECHLSLAPQWSRILNYFHYGTGSLAEGWVAPPDGTYQPRANVVGFTATPDIGEKRNLGEFFQRRSVNYSYLEAVEDGWLVAPVQKNIPVKIDIRKYRTAHTPTGNDFRTSDLSEALIPIIEELAEQTVREAADKKTIAFLPSVECARMMSAAIARRGLKSIFVSGECFDADEKTNDFVASGPGTVLSNAVLYAYGVDFPDVDCIAWYRPTISRAFYIQGIYRGTRVLPGVIDGLETAKERRAAIAASAKPKLLILDPLFVSDRIDLLDAYDLFTDKPEVKKRMKETGELSTESAERAERDFVKALNREARKHARKAARTIDPLSWAVSLGDAALASYEPGDGWESGQPTKGQLDFIRRQGIDTENVYCKGLASKIIGRIMTRLSLHLATPAQLDFLHKLGIEDSVASKLTMAEASTLLDQTLCQKRGGTPLPDCSAAAAPSDACGPRG